MNGRSKHPSWHPPPHPPQAPSSPSQHLSIVSCFIKKELMAVFSILTQQNLGWLTSVLSCKKGCAGSVLFVWDETRFNLISVLLNDEVSKKHRRQNWSYVVNVILYIQWAAFNVISGMRNSLTLNMLLICQCCVLLWALTW